MKNTRIYSFLLNENEGEDVHTSTGDILGTVVNLLKRQPQIHSYANKLSVKMQLATHLSRISFRYLFTALSFDC